MLRHYEVIALDLARERTRALALEAEQRRLLRGGGELGLDARLPRGNRLRTIIARPIRAFSDLTHAIAEAACSAATRIEGRTA